MNGIDVSQSSVPDIEGKMNISDVARVTVLVHEKSKYKSFKGGSSSNFSLKLSS